jgi:cytosine/adenosine deaminase-related metal-dependent hydrolase
MATNGGAAALGLADQIGSLEVGKKADVIVLDNGGLAAAPVVDFEADDPVKRIVSAFQSSSVQTSIIDGRLIMKDRQLLSMDEEEVVTDARRALARIRE